MFKVNFYVLSNSRSEINMGKKIWSFFLLSKTYKKNCQIFLPIFIFDWESLKIYHKYMLNYS